MTPRMLEGKTIKDYSRPYSVTSTSTNYNDKNYHWRDFDLLDDGQLALFKHNPDLKKIGSDYWLQDVYYLDKTKFAYLSDTSGSVELATDINKSVRPYGCIKA